MNLCTISNAPHNLQLHKILIMIYVLYKGLVGKLLQHEDRMFVACNRNVILCMYIHYTYPKICITQICIWNMYIPLHNTNKYTS